MVFEVNPLKTTFTVIMLVTVSQLTMAVPVPLVPGCGGFSLSGLSPGAVGPDAMKLRVTAGLPTASRVRRANKHTNFLMTNLSLLVLSVALQLVCSARLKSKKLVVLAVLYVGEIT
jgi:hypothetical protein